MDRAGKVNYYDLCEKRICPHNVTILWSVLSRYGHDVITPKETLINAANIRVPA